MASLRSQGHAPTRRRGGLITRLPVLLTLFLCLSVLFPAPASAAMSGSCRVPDVYLTFNSFLPRTERLMDRSAPVRILVIGPQIDQRMLSSKKLSKLQHALEARMPDVQFTILEEEAVPGLAQEDFGRIRSAVERSEPDLVIWQIGTGDALAGTDEATFAFTIDQAAEWLKGRNIYLVLVDPPFVPDVRHESRYGRIVQQIDKISDRESLNVLRQYGATTYLFSSPQSGARGGSGRLCLPELLAEAIVRAALR